MRSEHTAVWTGSEMLVWGGAGTYSNPDAVRRYTPNGNLWRPLTTPPNAPSFRYGHLAVWTGGEMIIWGGQNNGTPVSTGARYRPATDTWTPVSVANAPPGNPTSGHTAVWSGTEMIVWGSGRGDRYDPRSEE